MNYPAQGYPQQYPGQYPGQVPQAQFQPPPPPGYGYPPPGFQAPPPGYGQPAAPATGPQAPVLARGTLEDYLDQPTGGGGASVTKFFTDQRPQGSWLQVQVTRDLMNSDVRQQTDANDQPATYKNGKPKFVLIVPVKVLASSDGSHPGIFENGDATVWLKGITTDAFKQAMATAGIVNPEKALATGKLGGAVFVMTSAGTKAPHKPGYSGAKLFNFQYTPGGREMQDVTVPQVAAEVQAPVAQAAPPAPAAQAAPPPPAPAPFAAAPAGVPAPPVAPAPVAQAAPAVSPLSVAAAAPITDPATGMVWNGTQWIQPPPPATPAAAAPPPPPQAPADAEKAALLARLNAQG